jgi:hypothetical protein
MNDDANLTVLKISIKDKILTLASQQKINWTSGMTKTTCDQSRKKIYSENEMLVAFILFLLLLSKADHLVSKENIALQAQIGEIEPLISPTSIFNGLWALHLKT